MKHLALIMLAAASMAGTASVASAQMFGGGTYYDRSIPYYPYRYGERYYDDDQYYRRRHYRHRHHYRDCSPNFTV